MSLRLADFIFLFLAALLCVAAYHGTWALSPSGVFMDSDLQNYTQIFAARLVPGDFAHDPLVRTYKAFPGEPSLLTLLARLLEWGDGAVAAIFRAGALGIWLHLATYYMLGRWLIKSPGLAALFSLGMSVTIYWAFGTFWGATHADPVPRIYYADLFPFWLMLGCAALRRPGLRPLLLFAIGLSIIVHSVSALTCAAMFFAAFLLAPGGRSLTRHLGNSAVTAGAFLLSALPVLAVTMGHSVASDSTHYALFHEVWNMRAMADWSDPWGDLGRILYHYLVREPFLLFGLVCWIIARHAVGLSPRAQVLLSMFPGFLLGITGMLALCLVEMTLAAKLGYSHVSQELLRGTRFLIPLCWLSIVCALSLLWQRLPVVVRFAAPLGVVLLIGMVSQDKQVLAVRHSIAYALDLPALDSSHAAELMAAAGQYHQALQALHELTSPCDLVFTGVSDLAVRYVARRPLSPVAKDGWLLFYARDIELCQRWLREQRAFRTDPLSVVNIWRENPAQWLITPNRPEVRAALPPSSILFQNEGWVVAHKPSGTVN